MGRNLEALNNHIFDALDRLANAKDIDEIKTEIQRCNAVTNSGRTLIEEMKVGVEIAKLQERGNDYAEIIMPKLISYEEE